MAAETRTTIATVWAAFLSNLQTRLTTFRGVYEGDIPPDDRPAPHVSVYMISATESSRVAGDMVWEVRFHVRVVAVIAVATGSPTTMILGHCATVQNAIDNLAAAAGKSKPQDIEWGITQDVATTPGNIIYADAVASCCVVVTTGSN